MANKSNNKTSFKAKYNAFLQKDFNIVKNWKYYLTAPLVIVLVAVIIFACIGFNLGIDFTGGTILKVNFGTDISTSEYNTYKSDIETILKDNGISKYSMQKEGSTEDAAISIKFQDINGKSEDDMSEIITEVKADIEAKLNPNNANAHFEVEDSQRIGASASSNLLTNALLAVSIATVLMLIYIAIRFEFASGVAAIVALLHDVLIMCAMVIICRIQINSSFIAALITIIGYSINNTIVVFDRIRENLRNPEYSKTTNAQMVDISVRQTLTRTIYTSLTTIMSVFLLAIIGVDSIREFLFPIIIGLFAGTYSSIFVSGTIWSFIYKRSKDKRLQKRLADDKKKKEGNVKPANSNPEDKIVV